MKIRNFILVTAALVMCVIGFGLKPVASLAQTTPLQINAPTVELVMFEQDACEWCEVWNDQVGIVYHKTTEGKRAPLRRVDIHSPRPNDLRSLAPAVYTPTFVLVENGLEIGRIRGYPGEDFFWGMLDQLIGKLSASSNSST